MKTIKKLSESSIQRALTRIRSLHQKERTIRALKAIWRAEMIKAGFYEVREVQVREYTVHPHTRMCLRRTHA